MEPIPRNPSSRILDQGNRLDENEIQRIVEFYETTVQSRIKGPQLEGIEGEQIAEALREDPESILLVELLNKNGEVMQWPLLVSTEYHQDYSQHFFESHFPDQSSYCLSLPPYDSIETFLATPENGERVSEFIKDGGVVAYDYREGDDAKELAPALLNKLFEGRGMVRDVTPESQAWGREYGLPLALHYEGIARLARSKADPASSLAESVESLFASGEVKQRPQDGITIFSPEELKRNNDEILNQLWRIYEEQFDVLVHDHPLLGKQPFDEFKEMLLDKDTLNIALMSEDRVAGLLYTVHDIEKCVWLNKEYFDNEFKAEGDDNTWLTHIPGIVVAKEKAQQGAGYAQEMMNLLLKTVANMNKDMIITFACSNVSSKYIPKMTNAVLDRSPLYNFDQVAVSAEYGYRVLEVK